VGEKEGSTGVPILGSLGLGRWRSGHATMVKVAVEECSVQARSGHRERGRRGRGGVVGGADAEAPFYRVRGGAGRPGVGEEQWRRWYDIMMRKAAVSEGDQAGSDDEGCSGHYGSGRGRGTGRR
jgi:hypothetical protein